MIDFSSALYLGMRHPSHSLRPWDTLTLGAPSALREPEGAVLVAQKLAELQGCEQAVLAPSTLHLFWDLFGILSRDKIAIYMDAGVYPIGRWGVEHAASRGIPVRSVRHYCPDALSMALKHDSSLGKRPVILADGFCPACGKAAPVSEYARLATSTGGLLILDDTQSLGILGHSPHRDSPYGLGGGGILRWGNSAMNPHVLMVSSMAKGFGVPVAVLSGSNAMIRLFEDRSKIRTHCSPPSIAVIRAAEHALVVNRKHGDRIRLRLTQLVRYFRRRMAKAGFLLRWGLFPVQVITSISSRETVSLHEHLIGQGIRTVLQKRRAEPGARISLMINADHQLVDIDTLVDSIIHKMNALRHERTDVTTWHPLMTAEHHVSTQKKAQWP
jgi:8-amino-7-oxononanoate synthase